MIEFHEGVMALKTGFVGAGKVGFTLGKYLTTHGARVTGYYSRNTDAADDAAQFTHSQSYRELGDLVADSDVLFLTVPDSSIAAMAAAICEYPIQGKIICHCSGALSAEAAMPGAEQFGASVYSVHPLFAVSDRYAAYRELSDVFLPWRAVRIVWTRLTPGSKDWAFRCRSSIGHRRRVIIVPRRWPATWSSGLWRRVLQCLKPAAFPEKGRSRR